MSDLDVLFPEGKEVLVQGESLVIKPYTFGQIARVSKLAYPIVAALQDSGLLKIETIEGQANISIASDWPSRIVEIMGLGGEEFLQLVALSIGKPRAWLDTIQIDDGVTLAKAVIEVNSDFFAKRILPLLSVPKNPALDGDTSSPSLSPTDTETSTVTP